jgi:hypothetical protein
VKNQIDQMTPAQQTVFFEVYLPTFLQKTAMAGLPLEDAESINEALEATALLKMAMASQSQSVVKQANLSLKKALGIDKVQASAGQVKQAGEVAAQLAQNLDIRKAILAA